MTLTETGLSYRKSAIGGASTIGLMIVLFDTLAGDFRRAVAALHKNDIETRCREMNHAALVLGQLQDWVDLEKGGESAKTLTRFYAYLRSKMMEAAATKSAAILEAQIDMILHVRSSWQQLDVVPAQMPENSRMAAAEVTYSSIPEPVSDRIPFSQSA